MYIWEVWNLYFQTLRMIWVYSLLMILKQQFQKVSNFSIIIDYNRLLSRNACFVMCGPIGPSWKRWRYALCLFNQVTFVNTNFECMNAYWMILYVLNATKQVKMAVVELITDNAGTALLFVVTLVLLLLYQNARRPAGFPPGPLALPIIGNVLSEYTYTIH